MHATKKGREAAEDNEEENENEDETYGKGTYGKDICGKDKYGKDLKSEMGRRKAGKIIYISFSLFSWRNRGSKRIRGGVKKIKDAF